MGFTTLCLMSMVWGSTCPDTKWTVWTLFTGPSEPKCDYPLRVTVCEYHKPFGLFYHLSQDILYHYNTLPRSKQAVLI